MGGNSKPQKTDKDGGSSSSSNNNPSSQNGKKISSNARSFSERLDDFLFSEMSIAPLVYFRICFGMIMFYEVTRFFNSDKISRYYIEPEMYFKYFLWDWMPGPLPGKWMYIFYLWMGMIYIFYILGLWYRVTSVVAFLGFFYWFNLDVSQHLNHFYLISLISFLNMFLPLNRSCSLDVLCKPELRVSKVPAWTVYALIFIISVPYFFGGVAKINPDWLQGEPMRLWLLRDFPQGHFFTEWWSPYFFSWGGLVYDLFVSPMLIWKRTRALAVASTIFFHMANDNIFTIGIFPWFMMFSTPLYFPEHIDFVLQVEWIFCKPVKTKAVMTTPPERRSRVKYLLALFVAYNFYMPFRHHFYPGYSAWTEEGHLYAWHMMLREKESEAIFTIKYADGKKEVVNNSKYVSKRQNMRMKKRPEMLLQFAHHICKKATAADDGKQVEVYVKNEVSLNGRSKQHCIDPTVNLCNARVTWGAADWLLPLEVPLWDQSTKSRRTRILKRKGTYFVGSTVVEKVETETTSPLVLRFGTVTSYDEDSKTWSVRFNDDSTKKGFYEIVEYDYKDLARSHRLQAEYEHDALGDDVVSKNEVKSEL